MPKFLHEPIRMLHHLKNAGFTQEQAEAQVEIMTDCFENGLAEKRDLRILESSIRKDIKILEKDFKKELRELELKLIIKMTTITVTVVGFFYTLEKFF